MNGGGQAIALRLAGCTLQEIADHVGYKGPESSRRAILREMTRLGEPEGASELRRLESDRLDRLQRGFWPAAIEGDGEAADRVLRIMARRAKLLGLDAPTKQSIAYSEGAERAQIVMDDDWYGNAEKIREAQVARIKAEAARDGNGRKRKSS